MGLQEAIKTQEQILANTNKDFYPSQYAAAQAELARLISTEGNVSVDNTGIVGTGALTAITVNAEAGSISFSGSISSTVSVGNSFSFNLINSYITTATPFLANVYSHAQGYALSLLTAKSAGSVYCSIVGTTGVAISVSSCTVDFHVVTPRTATD